MGRRKELKSVCNDLLDSFVSRYNDLDGYWALGKFQSHLQSSSEKHLCFRLNFQGDEVNVFPLTLDYYRRAYSRHLKLRNLADEHVTYAVIKVEQRSPSELFCSFKITSYQGRLFEASRLVKVRPHDPKIELRRGSDFGPSNQKGV